MKKIIASILLLITGSIINAQTIGVGTSTPDASAILDVNSTIKGMLMPRMTTTERTNIEFPAKGLMVFDITTNTFWFYNGSSWINMATAGGGIVLPYTQSFGTPSTLLDLTNNGSGIGIKAASANNHGILGTTASASSAGIRGDASGTNSAGVRGSSSSATGVGVDAVNNTGGLALNVAGNLKISGGNTSPGDGKVLTSDANGNATWKANKIAFRADGIALGQQNLKSAVRRAVHFGSENYDYGNNYQLLVGSPTVSSSKFTVTKNGVYSIGASIDILVFSSSDNITNADFRIVLNRGGVTSFPKYVDMVLKDDVLNSMANGNISMDIKLEAGDTLWIEAYQVNSGAIDASMSGYFYGHLLFEE